MKKFAFISTLAPTSQQVELAEEKDIELVFINLPSNKFYTLTPERLRGLGQFDGIVTHHHNPAMMFRFQFDYEILLFEENEVESEDGKIICQYFCFVFGEAKNLKNYKQWYTSQVEINSRQREELEGIHQILDNLPRPPARSAPKTEENQWPSPYSLATRLAAWFGSR